MAELQTQTAPTNGSPQTGAQSQQPAATSGQNPGPAARRATDSFLISPWEFFAGSPFTLIRRMSEEIDNLFNQSMGGRTGASGNFWSPVIEVAERDGKYLIHAELPGLKPDELNVELRDNALLIRGERRREHQEEQGGVHRTERNYGRFYRVVPLPENVNPEQIEARFENGLLEVTAPLPQAKSGNRQIPIRSGSALSGGGQDAPGEPGQTVG